MNINFDIININIYCSWVKHQDLWHVNVENGTALGQQIYKQKSKNYLCLKISLSPRYFNCIVKKNVYVNDFRGGKLQ